MIQVKRCVGLVAACGLAVGVFGACGGDDGPKSPGGSYANIASAIESPSGTVDESSAVSVGEECEELSGAAVAAGMRQDAEVAQTQSGSYDCPAGGSINYSGSGNESSGSVTGSYDNCCFEAACCADGSADIFYSSEQGADFMYCSSYDISYSCEGVNADLQYSGCFGASGEWVYVIEVNGDTYAVSGNYSNGNGTLEITGENGTWTCTYTNDSGSCSGSGGESFTF